MSKPKEVITTEDYQTIRIEFWLALLFFVLYTVFYGIFYFRLSALGVLPYTTKSIGLLLYLAIGMRVFVPPIHRKGYLDLEQPTLKKTVPRGGKPSKEFLIKHLLSYGVAVIVLSTLFFNALANAPTKIDINNIPKVDLTPKALEEIETIPSLEIKETNDQEEHHDISSRSGLIAEHYLKPEAEYDADPASGHGFIKSDSDVFLVPEYFLKAMELPEGTKMFLNIGGEEVQVGVVNTKGIMDYFME